MARLDFYSTDMVGGPSASVAADTLYELGLMYCTGRGRAIDLIEAHKWFNLAAMRGNREARRQRTELAQEMTRGEISKAQRLAREWLSAH